ncbi:MAG: Gfo/Idh/MocA family oxidoreductase [Planctomycetes bacterium]|nr:Gfo/Idh/MocA family oxidoreductase [Planctomycetota bacterium]
MSPPIAPSRRSFLTGSAAALGVLALPACAAFGGKRTTKGRLRHAAIGVGGMGGVDLERIASHPDVDVVALCDVDAAYLAKAREKHPNARAYRDWRELMEHEDDFDSVHVTIPDHMHAIVMLAALERDKHLYGQKPLTRTVREARSVGEAARRARTATQMGIQNRSQPRLRAAHALFQQDHIGRVHTVHVWTDRPAGWWPQGVERPETVDPVPETLDWDLWLGVAPARPYVTGKYHPFAWRGWKDFGSGAQGDMGCHLMDPALWFLELGAPLNVRSDGPVPNGETFPPWSEVRYEFAPTRHTTRGPLVLHWHDGGKQPPRALLDDLGAGEIVGNGCLFVGEKGALLASSEAPPRLLGDPRLAAVAIPAGDEVDHWHQWVDACLGRGETTAHFEYAGHLTEVVLLGNVALELPHEELAWDAERLAFPARPEADRFLGSAYREGWG